MRKLLTCIGMGHAIVAVVLGLALLAMPSVATAADVLIDDGVDRYSHLTICQPDGNMTEAMTFRADRLCKEAKAQVDAGKITKAGCGSSYGTFSVDANGNSCPDTALDRIGEVVAVAVLATAVIEVGAAALGGGEVGGVFYGSGGLFHTSGKIGAAVAGF